MDPNWNENDFTSKLTRVMRCLADRRVPLLIAVYDGNRLAALRACVMLDLARRSVRPPGGHQSRIRWIVVGRDRASVDGRAAEIEQRIELEERLSIALARARDEQQEEQAPRREGPEPEPEPEPQHVQGEFGAILASIPTASLEQLQAIKESHFMYQGEVLDPDVDVWIPDDPRSTRLGLIKGTGNEKLKNYWVAQCCLRGIRAGDGGDPQNSIVFLQALLRDRHQATEDQIQPLKELCEEVLDAEWRLSNPLTRFNVRAVRKARQIMVAPREDTQARKWTTLRHL